MLWVKQKRHRYLHTKDQIQSKLFMAFYGWPIYSIHGGINFGDEKL